MLKSCVFYTLSDDVYTVMEALKELGLLVELTDSSFAHSMNLYFGQDGDWLDGYLVLR